MTFHVKNVFIIQQVSLGELNYSCLCIGEGRITILSKGILAVLYSAYRCAPYYVHRTVTENGNHSEAGSTGANVLS
jgi:hypothetical protein